jgi:hypothetical protein
VQRFTNALAREPAAIGTLVASVLPALVALQIISIDEQAIGVLVVAINAIAAFFVRMVVSPAAASETPIQLDPAHAQTQE